ncbi:MAG: STAS domain-containing protein [Candidatus Omnitrophica bacterium]|nr:STAS domain-containing protein [Candidatus Omnitrophota bacterium]
MTKRTFEPKIITVLREGYSLPVFLKDLMAGVIVGIVAIPLAIAFAIASGVKPEQGIITAFIGGLLISLFSGSRTQIGGPTGAFIIIVLGIIQKYGYEGLALATLMAGVILVIMGLMRFGEAIKYIPYPVTIGFTSGIAVVIFSTQIQDFLGLNVKTSAPHFFDKLGVCLNNLSQINPFAVGLSILTILVIKFWPLLTRKIPGTIIAIILTTFIARFFHLPVAIIGERFGSVSFRLSFPHLPQVNIDVFTQLISPAITIAILAGIESLLSAVVADGMLGTRHRSNMELVGQGIANIVSPLFGGIPATGAIARTATNIKNGGRTPFSGIIHAVTVCVLFVFFAPMVGFVPMATLAGILIVVSYQMSEWRHFKQLLKSPRSDVLLLLTTFLLTILVDLTVAIEVGVVMAAILFMHRMAELTHMSFVEEDDDNGRPHEYEGVPEGVEIFEINGPFFFGAADKFREAISSFKKLPQVLILRMSAVPAVDATAVNTLQRFIDTAEAGGTQVVFAGVNKRVFRVFDKYGIVKRIGIENILTDVPLALARAISFLK